MARAAAMKARGEEILEEVSRHRREASFRCEELKALADEATVKNDEETLRLILEELHSSLPGGRRNTAYAPQASQRRPLSAGPSGSRSARASLQKRPTSARGSARTPRGRPAPFA